MFNADNCLFSNIYKGLKLSAQHVLLSKIRFILTERTFNSVCFGANRHAFSSAQRNILTLCCAYACILWKCCFNLFIVLMFWTNIFARIDCIIVEHPDKWHSQSFYQTINSALQKTLMIHQWKLQNCFSFRLATERKRRDDKKKDSCIMVST